MNQLKRIMNFLEKNGMDKKKENRDRILGIRLIIIVVLLFLSCVTTQKNTLRSNEEWSRNEFTRPILL